MDTPAYLVLGIVKWLLILPISHRLYTSVIVPNPEKWLPKVSCPTDMSPTAILLPPYLARGMVYTGPWRVQGGGVYPGYGMAGWVPGGLYRYPGQTRPRTIFSIYLALGPYLRPNEG